MNKEQLIKTELSKSVALIQAAIVNLELSIEICSKIWKEKNMFSFDELNQFEALCSRYARIADIFTQKIIKPAFILLEEDVPLFIDRTNLAEKIGLIDNAELVQDFRRLRNKISHEYLMEDYTEIFEKVLEFSPMLISEIRKAISYLEIKQFIDLNYPTSTPQEID